MTTEEYEREALKDLKLDVTQFQEYCQSLGLKRIKWSRYLFNEETLLNAAEDRLRGLYKDKFHYYAYEYNEQKIDKKNIEIYIKGDADYRMAQQAVLKQESKMKFVNEVLCAIDKQSFQCGNILKYLMWQQGSITTS